VPTRTASGLGRSPAARFISISLDTHTQFPNHEPPTNSPVTTYDMYVPKYLYTTLAHNVATADGTTVPWRISHFSCYCVGPTLFRSEKSHHCIVPSSTSAGFRDALRLPPPRGMYRHAPTTGWVPIPVSMPTTSPPGRFPYPPFPVSGIKTHVDPVAVPSSAPGPSVLIPSFI
jgi:hypothetical protein